MADSAGVFGAGVGGTVELGAVVDVVVALGGGARDTVGEGLTVGDGLPGPASADAEMLEVADGSMADGVGVSAKAAGALGNKAAARPVMTRRRDILVHTRSTIRDEGLLVSSYRRALFLRRRC